MSSTPPQVAFFVAGKPVAQPRQRLRLLKTPRGVRCHNYVSRGDAVQKHKALVLEAATLARASSPGRWRTDLLFRVELAFLFPRPRRLGDGQPGRDWRPGTPDLDNLAKAVLDALNGLLWDDDGQVVACLATKFYAAVGEPPGTHVLVQVASPRTP